MRINPPLYKSVTLAFLGLWFILAADLSAGSIRTPTGQLNLVATIDGKPAFRAITWHLRRQEFPDEVVKTLHRHAAVLHLKPGIYNISATLGDTTRTAVVTIREGGEHALELEMSVTETS